MDSDLLEQYDQQLQVEFDGDSYLVRDNGAVLRRPRPGQRKRILDGIWTFGRPDKWSGYMHVGSHVVHRIVALAFHGERPSDKHIVDHIDTNRRNNRADNLRWLTRLDNLLLNPITRRRIEMAYGSLEKFFRNPGAPREPSPDFDWMRTVTREEAEESRKRLLQWAVSGPMLKGGQLGEWVYGSQQPASAMEEVQDRQSLTPIAIQRDWKTPSEFPNCPSSLGSDPLGEYVERLTEGVVFTRNRFGETSTVMAGRKDGVAAVLASLPEGSVKPWAVTKVTVENARFVHGSVRTFFSPEGARKAYHKLLDPNFDESSIGECIDDFC